MKPFGELYQTADWKAEKHVPVIECPDTVKAGEPFQIKVTLGREITHPNTAAHHIKWITIYFMPEDAKFPHEVGQCIFSAHGESTEGVDTGTVYAHHEASLTLKTGKPGTLYAASLCNIHGLWYSQKDVKLA